MHSVLMVPLSSIHVGQHQRNALGLEHIEASPTIRKRPIAGKPTCNMCQLIINAIAIVNGCSSPNLLKQKFGPNPNNLLQHSQATNNLTNSRSHDTGTAYRGCAQYGTRYGHHGGREELLYQQARR